ncbi:transposase family protein, partial [Streptomyces avermitilis]|uniref:transposase family protein n=1 Tax=Streptomyces avermitilis TaxID=33903 RepID=UPI00380E88B2
MLVYPSGLDVASSALRFLSARLREHRRGFGTRWRRLSAGRQALFALAHLRNGRPYVQLAAGFGVGTSTAYRYVTEAVEVLAALAPTFAEAVRTASMKAFVLLDGTLLPIDRIAADRPFCSGKHKRHGMDVQIVAADYQAAFDWVEAEYPGRPGEQIPGLARFIAEGLPAISHRGCPFINSIAELPDRSHPARQVIEKHKAHQARRLVGMCAEAGLPDPEHAAAAITFVLGSVFKDHRMVDHDGVIRRHELTDQQWKLLA